MTANSVPYTFANQSGLIPLSELDANFDYLVTSAPYANLAAQVSGNIQSNITQVGTLSTLSVSGNIYGNLVGQVALANTVTNNAQPNITSLGTLSSLAVTANVTAGSFVGNGAGLTNVVAASMNAGNLTGNTLSPNIVNSTLTSVGTLSTLSVSGNVRAAAGFYGNLTGNVTGIAAGAQVAFGVAGANVSGPVAIATFANTAGAANTANTATTAVIAGTVTTNAQPNITSVGTLTSLSSSGNIAGNYIFGNGSLLTGLPATYTNANVSAFLPTYTGNITAGNILTNNYLYANGQPISFNLQITSGNVSYTAPFGGGILQTGTTKWAQFVSVLDFGADPTGATDSRGAFQAALNTAKHVYIPTGNYKISDRLLMLYPGQMMSGDGRGVSVLQITSGFNLSATGVLVFNTSSSGEGPILRDFGISFAQPDTATRGALTSYPPAIYAVATPRFTVENMLIQGAMVGINMTGNSGGAFINLLEMSAFTTGIQIDGALDTVRIDQFHFWPFNLTTNQQSIFYSTGTTAITVGRCDGLMINEFLNISNLGLYMFTSGLGHAEVYITNSAFDTNNGIVQTGGYLEVTNSYITVTTNANLNGYVMGGANCYAQFTNCWFSSGSTNQSMILIETSSNSTLNISQGIFQGGIANYPYIYVNGSSVPNCSVQVSDSTFALGSASSSVLTATATSGPFALHFVNNLLQTATNNSYSNAQFAIAAGYQVCMTNNRANTKGTSAATFISIAADNYNAVSLNVAPGWTNSFPTPVHGYYSNNIV